MYSVDVEELKQSIQIIILEFQPWIKAVSQIAWNPEQGVMPLIERAILRRQFDCLDSIIYLVDGSRGYAAVPLLRAACEELLWVKYLRTMKPEIAEELMTCLVKGELLDNLSAQDAYSGSSVMDDLGLSTYLQAEKKVSPKIASRLRAIGKKLGWDQRTLKKGTRPSTFYIAQQTNMVSMYNFLYHGTSRYVHFSSIELLRRTWGRSGNVTVDSSHFNDYWAIFSLHWGLSLFFDTFNEIEEALSQSEHLPNVDEEKIQQAAKRVGEFGQVPLITKEELL